MNEVTSLFGSVYRLVRSPGAVVAVRRVVAVEVGHLGDQAIGPVGASEKVIVLLGSVVTVWSFPRSR